MNANLKECPFCGSAAMLEDHRTIWRVACASLECGAQVLGDRAPEPDGEMGDAYWAAYQQTAIDRWNARAIAAPVAAGSVDTPRLQQLMMRLNLSAGCDGIAQAKKELISHINAWGAQQREAGRQQHGHDVCRESERLYRQSAKDAIERAEKAEGDLAEAQRQVAMYSICMNTAGVDALYGRVNAAEARVKELEAGRQALQAEGKHPAPCARHCEANAFQIEVRRLEAVELDLHRKLAAEKLRADQGWARYEAANRAKNDLERQKADRASPYWDGLPNEIQHHPV